MFWLVAASTPRRAREVDAASTDYFLGLISGTSVDGIDAALVAFDGGLPRSLWAHTYAYEEVLRESILAHSQRERSTGKRQPILNPVTCGGGVSPGNRRGSFSTGPKR